MHFSLFVDDMLIVSKIMHGINENDKYPSSQFRMKNLGVVDIILGIKVIKHSGVHAFHYAEKFQKISAFGSLMYVMHCTRLNVSFIMCKLSIFTNNTSIMHWKAISRILSYLKITEDYGLFYERQLVVLEGYSDASWKTSTIYKKSTFGWVFLLANGVVSWALKKQTCISTKKKKKQTCIAYSTMYFEFIARLTASKKD